MADYNGVTIQELPAGPLELTDVFIATTTLGASKKISAEEVFKKIDNYQVNTRAIADAFAATLTHSAFIEVLADETQGGIRALYFWNTISLQEPLLL